MNSQRHNPYVGPRTFSREESHLFFGREREARDLLSLVISERLVLFYAQSGGGKSSLINTRLILGLEDRGFEVLPVGRVGGILPPGTRVSNIFVYNLLLSLSHREDEARPLPDPNITLKDFLREYDLEETATGGDVVPLEDEDDEIWPRALIIDQFEEILATNLQEWEKRQDFFIQLRDALEDDEHLWVILSMREDYVAGLTPYVHLLPGKLKARFYMERMEVEAALQAVKEPVRGRRPFAEGVAEKLVDNLRQISIRDQGDGQEPIAGQYIKPVQLQVVCYQLWEKLKDQQGTKITDEDLWSLAGGEDLAQFVDQALAQFYEQAIAQVVKDVPGRTEFELRDWCENKLITKTKTRALVHQEAQKTDGLDNEVVRELEDLFLLRAESRAGSRWYELVHDRLVDPILQANTDWRRVHPLIQSALEWKNAGEPEGMLFQGQQLTEAFDNPDAEISMVQKFLEAGQEAEKRRELAIRAEEEKKRADEQAKAARRLRRLAVGLVVVALLAAGAAIFAIANKNLADIKAVEAKSAQAAAEASAAEAETARAAAEASEVRARLALTRTVSSLVAADAASYVYWQPERALLLSLEAIERYDSFETRRVLFTELARNFYHFTSKRDLRRELSRVAFNPDGKIVAMASFDGSITLWDVENNKLGCQHSYIDMQRPVYGLAFHPYSQTLAAATGYEYSGYEHSITLWDITSEKPARQVIADQLASAGGIAFSPDGQTLAAGNFDGTIALWDLSVSEPTSKTLPGSHASRVWDVEFSPVLTDGKALASVGEDSIIFWELKDGDWISRTFKGHKARVNGVAFSPDGQTLASANDDGTIILWDVATGQAIGEPLFGHNSDVSSVAFSPDGKMLASGGWDQSVRLWNVETHVQIGSALTRHTSGVQDVAFSPDGQTLASVGLDGAIVLWNIRELYDRLVISYADAISDVAALSLDGKTLSTAGEDNTITLWDLTTSEQIGQLTNEDRIIGMAFSSDGQTLAVASDNEVTQTITLWNVTRSEPITRRSFTDHTTWVSGSLAFNSYSNTLVLANEDGDIILWDLGAGDWVSRTFAGHEERVNDIALSPDGQTLASANGDGTIVLRDVTIGQAIGEPFAGHSGEVWSVAFSPDGQMLASTGSDGTIRLWDVDTGQSIGPLPGHRERVLSMAFSEDGQTLVLAGPSAVISRSINLEEWMELACEIAGRNLTQSEWEAAFGRDEPYGDPICPFPAHRTAVEAAIAEGERHARQLEIPEAEQAFERANELLAETQEKLDPKEKVIRVLIEQVREFIRQKNLDRAGDYLDVIANLGRTFDLDRDTIWQAGESVERGRQYIDDGKYYTALQDLNKATELDPWFEFNQKSDLADLYHELCIGFLGIDTLSPACKRAVALAVETEDATLNRSICQNESTRLTDLVSPACERFVQLEDKTISFGETITGVIESSQSDTWIFTGQEGQIVSIEMKHDCGKLDPYLVLVGPHGKTLTGESGGGEDRNAKIGNFTLPQDGVYVIQAQGYYGSGAYTLSLIEVDVKEIAFSDSVEGNISIDVWWAFEGQAGQIINVAMDEAGSGLDTRLTLLGPDEKTLSTDDNSGQGTNALIGNFVLPQDGSYTIIPDGDMAYGTYTLSLIEVITQSISFAETVRGSVGDGILWAFEGQVGQIINIAMDEDDSGLDARLTLLGPSWTTLSTDDNSGQGTNALIRSFILPEDGSYTIIPDGYGIPSTYSLSLTEATIRPISFTELVEGAVGDSVLWAFEGQAGQVINVAMDEDGSGLDARLTLLGPDREVLDTDDNSGQGTNALIRGFILPEDGSYTIIPDGHGIPSTYTLSLTEAVMQAISFTEPVEGDIGNGVLWAFEGQAGQIINIAMDEDGSGLDTLLTLLGPDGTTLSIDDDSGDGQNSLIRNFVLPEDGSYTIIPGGYSISGAYTLSLIEVTARPKPITSVDYVTGNTADNTKWTFSGQANQIVRITMFQEEPVDMWFSVLGPDDDCLSPSEEQVRKLTLMLPAKGTYTIVPEAAGPSAAYALSLIEMKAQSITPGEVVRADTANDFVWTFEGRTRQEVRIAIAEDSSGINPSFAVLDPNGDVVAEDNGGSKGRNALVSYFILQMDGKYTIVPDVHGPPGAYSLSLTEQVPQLIAMGETVSDDIVNRTQWIFEGEAGQIVNVAMDEDGSGLDTRLTLLGPNKTTLNTNDDSGKGSNALIRNFVLPKDGFYTIISDGYDSSGAYLLSLSEAVTQPISIDAPIEGNVADNIVWAFEGQAGQIVKIAMGEAGSDLDTRLTLLGSDGRILSTDDDSGYKVNALIRGVVLPQDDTYTILAEGDAASGAYLLLLSEMIAQPISFGKTITGAVEDDVVWVFEGQVRQIVRIELQKSEGELDARLILGRPDGTTTIIEGDVGGLIANLALPETGMYTLIVQGDEESAGAYTLSLDEIVSQGSLTYGQTANGQILGTSTDYWVFTGNAGEVAKIIIESRSFDLNLRLYNPNAALIGEYDSSEFPHEDLGRLIHITGTHIIAVSGIDDSQSGPYTLSLDILPDTLVRMEKHEFDAFNAEFPKDWNVDSTEIFGITILIASSADIKAESLIESEGDWTDTFGDNPAVMFMVSPPEMIVDSDFSVEGLKSMPDEEPDVEFTKMGDITVDDVKGYQLVGKGKMEDISNKDVGVHLAALEYEDGAMAFIGVSPQKDMDKNLGIFEYILKSIKFN